MHQSCRVAFARDQLTGYLFSNQNPTLWEMIVLLFTEYLINSACHGFLQVWSDATLQLGFLKHTTMAADAAKSAESVAFYMRKPYNRSTHYVVTVLQLVGVLQLFASTDLSE